MGPMPTPTSPAPARKEADVLADAIAALRLGDVRAVVVRGLADLSREGRATLAAAWPGLPVDVRRKATRQMGKLAGDRVELSFGRALRVALDDEAAAVRQLALAALWEDENSDLLARLAGLVDDDPSSDVRAEAARGLGRFARRAAEGELDPAAADALLALLERLATEAAQPAEVRRGALESLGAFGSPRVSRLIEDAYRSGDHGFRLSAIVAMGRSMDGGWLQTLIEELSAADVDVRLEAARSLGEIGDSRAVQDLATACADDHGEVRQAAIAALGRIGGGAAARALQRVEQEASAADRVAIDAALSEAQGDQLPF